MGTFLKWVVVNLQTWQRLWRRIGAYVLLATLMPGGTLLALLLFLVQRRPDIRRRAQRAVSVVTRALASVFEQRIWVPVPIRVTIPVSKSDPQHYRAKGTR